MKAMNHILSDSHTFLLQMQKNITKTIIKNDTLSPECIQKRLDELQQELIQHATNRQNYNAIANEIFRLREQKEEAERNNQSQQENIKRLESLQKFIKEHPTQLSEFNETTIRKIIEKITVFPDHFVVRFKSGIEVTV